MLMPALGLQGPDVCVWPLRRAEDCLGAWEGTGRLVWAGELGVPQEHQTVGPRSQLSLPSGLTAG